MRWIASPLLFVLTVPAAAAPLPERPATPACRQVCRAEAPAMNPIRVEACLSRCESERRWETRRATGLACRTER